MEVEKLILFGIFGFIGLLLLSGTFTIVDSGQRGVVTHFGKVQDYILDEGFHFKMPIATTIHRLSIRVQKTQSHAEAASKDIQKVHAEVAINWNIDPKTVNFLFQNIGNEKEVAERIISPAVSEVLKAATAKRTAEEILMKRLELKDEIDSMLMKRLSNYNLIVRDISLVDLGFTEEFNRAVENKQIAEQSAKQAEYEALKAEKDAKATVNKARGQAEAQKLQKLTITKEILQKMAIEKWDGRFPQVMGSGAMPFINMKPEQFAED